jgi:WD40 repeat protein
MDGRIYDWNVRTGKKEWEYDSQQQGASFSSICISPDSKVVYGLTSDGCLKVS